MSTFEIKENFMLDRKQFQIISEINFDFNGIRNIERF